MTSNNSSAHPDLLIIRPLGPDLMAALSARYRLHRLDEAQTDAARAEVLAAAGPACRVAITSGKVGLDGIALADLPVLRLLASYTAGYEGIDLAALHKAGVELTTASGALADEVADTALMLMLAARRDLRRADLHVRNGDWGRKGAYPLQESLKAARLGLVGAGHIGQAVARRGAVLGMDLAYWGRRARPDVAFRHEPDLIQLANWADVMVVAVAGGPDTRHLINAPVLEALGGQGTLINIARGSIVDEEALVAALRSGTIANAGLDVFENEPNPDPRLTELENITLYPHHASGTRQTRAAMGQSVLDSLDEFFAGHPLSHRVA